MCPRDGTWILWVSILASEKESRGYEVKMTAAPKGDRPASLASRGKVYSVDVGKRDVIRDTDGGIMELSKGMVKKLGKIEDGHFKIKIDYKIFRK